MGGRGCREYRYYREREFELCGRRERGGAEGGVSTLDLMIS